MFVDERPSRTGRITTQNPQKLRINILADEGGGEGELYLYIRS